MLWVMVVLCAVALHMTFSSHLRLQVTASIGDSAKAHSLARAGVERAIADLTEGRDKLRTLADVQEGEGVSYCNIGLGEGSYTLLAGLDAAGQPHYGIMDESAKINIVTAAPAILSKVSGMNSDLVAEILEARSREAFHQINDLLLLEGIDLQQLFGEDRNGNGLLDSNEDDGGESWPPDNADARLDTGLVALLTTWSATRNVTVEGKDRVNIGSASADQIVKSLSGITSEQAKSIVEHRKKRTFTNIADLLDVQLVSEESSGSDSKSKKSAAGAGRQESAAKTEKDDKRSTSSESKDNASEESTTRKAFDEKTFRGIADSITTTDDEVLKGMVNLNTAPREILACLPGIADTVAREIVLARENRKEGFKTVADLLDVEGISLDMWKKICPCVSVRSDVFSVRSFGVVEKSGFYRCVEAIIDRTDESARIRYWRELE